MHLREARRAGRGAIRALRDARRYERQGMVLQGEVARRKYRALRADAAWHLKQALLEGDLLGLNGMGPAPEAA